jgi:hypothetical protein
MESILDRYLNRVLAVADLREPARESQVRQELRDHLEQKTEALRAEGYPEAEALLKAIETHGNPVVIGYRLRPWRLIDVRMQGTARGVIAIGPRAYGVVAIGGLAIGLVAMGGAAIGLLAFGGFSLALLLAVGGLAGGLFAYGGLAVGAVALGGFAIGVIACGGSALGLWVPGAGQVLWSYFTDQTAPQWLHHLTSLFSLDVSMPGQRQSFMRLTNLMVWLNFVLLGLMLSLQLGLMRRERKRLQSLGQQPVGADWCSL